MIDFGTDESRAMNEDRNESAQRKEDSGLLSRPEISHGMPVNGICEPTPREFATLRH